MKIIHHAFTFKKKHFVAATGEFKKGRHSEAGF